MHYLRLKFILKYIRQELIRGISYHECLLQSSGNSIAFHFCEDILRNSADSTTFPKKCPLLYHIYPFSLKTSIVSQSRH